MPSHPTRELRPIGRPFRERRAAHMTAWQDQPPGGDAAERERLLAPLLEDVETLAGRGLAAISELPAYKGQSAEFLEDVIDQIRRNYTALLRALLEGRAPTADELAFQRRASMRRARAGFALEDYLSAYRVAQQVLWDSIVEFAEQAGVDQHTVLTLASQLMRNMDLATTHAGQAYVEFRQYGLAALAKERRDLLECVLAGTIPKAGPMAAAADRYGLTVDAPALVAVAIPLGPGSERDASEMASATFARAGLQEPNALVVIRHAEIVAVLSLAAGRDPEGLCACLERAQKSARREGTPLAIGVSTIAHGAPELPGAYREALAAVRFVGKDGGVAALTRLSVFDYLALTADETARRLIAPAIIPFLNEDRRRGGVLVSTIRAYAAAGLSLKHGAARLHIHTNTLQYRLQRVEEQTGLDPRRFEDIHTLLVAIAVHEAAARN